MITMLPFFFFFFSPSSLISAFSFVFFFFTSSLWMFCPFMRSLFVDLLLSVVFSPVGFPPPPSLGDRPRTRPRFVQYKTDLSGFVFNSDHLSYVIHILGKQHSMYIMPISTKRFSFPNFGSYDTDTYITPRVSILASDVK